MNSTDSNWERCTNFSIELPDRPGSLAALAARFRQADVHLLGLWGAGESEGPATFHCVPESPDQFRNFLASTDLEAREGSAFYVSGASHGDALVETLDRIAGAGINLQAIQGLSQNGEFGCFIWADEDDWPALERLLSA